MSTRYSPMLGAAMVAATLGAACNGCNVQPQNVSATATVSGLDGVSSPTSETLTLTHNAGDTTAERVAVKRVSIPQVKDFGVSVTRTGLPIDETFILINISRAATAPGSSAPQPTVVAVDGTYISDHVGNLQSVSVDTARVDAPLTAARTDVFPNRQRTGYTLFARWHKDDPCMPFTDAAAPTDVSRMTAAIFTALSASLVAADGQSDLFSLGGPANDGNFEMFFVPHAQHSSVTSFDTPANGFTLIFKAAIRAGLVDAEVFVPLSILFNRLPGGAAGDSLDARLDLLDFGVESEDVGRVTVMANGFFERPTAEAIRQAVLNAVTGMPADRRETVIIALGLFSAALNAVRENQGPLPATVRVVLMPGAGAAAGGPMNRVLPGGALSPTLCILMSN